MPNNQVEYTKYVVPVDSGYLIGNTLRQFAMRGTGTWQVAAYRVAEKTGTFGLSDGYPFHYLELLKGKLVSSIDEPIENEKLCKFKLLDKTYVCDDMKIVNLEGLGVPSLDVCLVFANGSRTASQNYAVARRLCALDVTDYIAVPSKHTPTIKFRYNIEPLDQSSETLVIEATPGVVELARQSAVKSLAGLHI